MRHVHGEGLHLYSLMHKPSPVAVSCYRCLDGFAGASDCESGMKQETGPVVLQAVESKTTGVEAMLGGYMLCTELAEHLWRVCVDCNLN